MQHISSSPSYGKPHQIPPPIRQTDTPRRREGTHTTSTPSIKPTRRPPHQMGTRKLQTRPPTIYPTTPTTNPSHRHATPLRRHYPANILNDTVRPQQAHKRQVPLLQSARTHSPTMRSGQTRQKYVRQHPTPLRHRISPPYKHRQNHATTPNFAYTLPDQRYRRTQQTSPQAPIDHSQSSPKTTPHRTAPS